MSEVHSKEGSEKIKQLLLLTELLPLESSTLEREGNAQRLLSQAIKQMNVKSGDTLFLETD